MTLAKIFNNGRSQAVRLPKEYRFKDEEVLINKIGEVVILMPKKRKWENLQSSLDMFSSDYFKDGRNQGDFEIRELL